MKGYRRGVNRVGETWQPRTGFARLTRRQSYIRATGGPHFHGCDAVGLATGASFRRGEWTLLSGHYFAAEIASPAGDGWHFGRRRLFRHTRTTRGDALGSFHSLLRWTWQHVHVRTPTDTNRRAQAGVAPRMPGKPVRCARLAPAIRRRMRPRSQACSRYGHDCLGRRLVPNLAQSPTPPSITANESGVVRST
jgi:hypothetical protein